jgi:hypothetical protein
LVLLRCNSVIYVILYVYWGGRFTRVADSPV